MAIALLFPARTVPAMGTQSCFQQRSCYILAFIRIYSQLMLVSCLATNKIHLKKFSRINQNNVLVHVKTHLLEKRPNHYYFSHIIFGSSCPTNIQPNCVKRTLEIVKYVCIAKACLVFCTTVLQFFYESLNPGFAAFFSRHIEIFCAQLKDKLRCV